MYKHGRQASPRSEARVAEYLCNIGAIMWFGISVRCLSNFSQGVKLRAKGWRGCHQRGASRPWDDIARVAHGSIEAGTVKFPQAVSRLVDIRDDDDQGDLLSTITTDYNNGVSRNIAKGVVGKEVQAAHPKGSNGNIICGGNV
ncbi:hypothetical protein C8J57DRAFT_1234068 [Mycena rebaudengoi]|nr:hypothetical protein C8J57DRAFT_1234068 [Mycena rebaudengoi]